MKSLFLSVLLLPMLAVPAHAQLTHGTCTPVESDVRSMIQVVRDLDVNNPHLDKWLDSLEPSETLSVSDSLTKTFGSMGDMGKMVLNPNKDPAIKLLMTRFEGLSETEADRIVVAVKAQIVKRLSTK